MILFLKKLKDKGFSLTEILIAAGVAGGVGLLVAKLNNNTLSISSTSQTNSEINYFLSEVSYILSNKENCNATIETNVGGGADIGAQVTAIRKIVRGQTINQFERSPRSYGQNSFEINSMTTETSPAGINLVFNITRLNKNKAGANTVVKRIPLKAVLINGKIKSCYSDNESIIEKATRDACQGNTVFWDDVNKECHHNIVQNDCLPGQVLQRVTDTNGTITSQCIPIIETPVTCPDGEYFKSITTTGVITCAPLTYVNTCARNEYVRSISDGRVICESIPQCAGNQILKANSSGILSCFNLTCATNQYFAGFNSDGSVNCKAFRTVATCGNNQYVREISSDGTPVCAPVPNHQNLTQINFSFVDGFNDPAWTRKTIAQTAQEVCARFGNRRWNGSACELTTVNPPINGGWSSWSPWSLCSGGSQTRTRTCTNPAPSNGGADCVGAAMEGQTCELTPIPTTGSSGGGCFIAGSKITMEDGRQSYIEDIQVGEVLLDVNGNKNTVQNLIRLSYEGPLYGINGDKSFFTPNHPFKTLDGWKSLAPEITKKEIPEIKVKQLQIGDVLIKENGFEILMSLEKEKDVKTTVFNFELNGTREYIVNEYSVHNKRMCPLPPPIHITQEYVTCQCPMELCPTYYVVEQGQYYACPACL